MSGETEKEVKVVEVGLPLAEAEAAHAALERIMESGAGDETLELLYRRLGWRILAVKEGSGLTARIAEMARDAESLEQFEHERDRELGPIISGLERGENRDP